MQLTLNYICFFPETASLVGTIQRNIRTVKSMEVIASMLLVGCHVATTKQGKALLFPTSLSCSFDAESKKENLDTNK